MSIDLYMDHHVPRAITQGLRARGVNVVTAYEDGADQMLDPELLDRADHLGRVLFTQDQDLLAVSHRRAAVVRGTNGVEAAKRRESGTFFRGVICIRQAQISIGACIQDLENIAKVYDPEDLFNLVEYLPLK
ncbi:MAG: DUF5615 family PIN-like protein [Kiritimatiellae bacterium]|nr:DUF5615 family PIN-like protein [Kiritimatiellia bacterium]